MDHIKFIKSFSKGQITIPKEFRHALGLKDESWFQLTLDQGKIIAEPMYKPPNQNTYLSKLKKMKTNWFTKDCVREIKEGRKEVEKRLRRNGL